MDSSSWWALLLDLDGTLIRSDDLHRSLWTQILSSYGITLTQEAYHDRIAGRSDAAIWEEWGVGTAEERARLTEWKEEAFLRRIKETVPVPGGKERIQEWVRAGQWVGVVTNSNEKTALALLQRIGIDHVLDVLITGDSGCAPKPSPEPYQRALYELGIPVERCVVVEDSEVGLASARALGPARLFRMCLSPSASPPLPSVSSSAAVSSSAPAPSEPHQITDFYDDQLAPPSPPFGSSNHFFLP